MESQRWPRRLTSHPSGPRRVAAGPLVSKVRRQMFNRLKSALAPATASYAVQRYWAGDFLKAIKFFDRAERWYPTMMSEDPTYIGYRGLAHFHLGNGELAIKYLQTALLRLEEESKIATSPEFKIQLIQEIKSAVAVLAPNHHMSRTPPQGGGSGYPER